MINEQSLDFCSIVHSLHIISQFEAKIVAANPYATSTKLIW